MAKQTGDIKITGSIEDLCFYQMEGAYYVRMKSSLTGKRFWKDAAFDGSRKSCSRFALGNQLAAQVYRKVAKEKRQYALFCLLKSKAIFYLKQGLCQAAVTEALLAYLPGVASQKRRKVKKGIKTPGPVVPYKDAPRVFTLPAAPARQGRCRRFTPV